VCEAFPACLRGRGQGEEARRQALSLPPGPFPGPPAKRGEGSLHHPQPIERALQDEDRGVLVDDGFALAAADVGGDQFALYGGR
jgi:hypothetical protein